MSLREEIAESVKSYLIRNKFEVADECINKVLDAAVEAVDEIQDCKSAMSQHHRSGFNSMKRQSIRAIQRLKEGK